MRAVCAVCYVVCYMLWCVLCCWCSVQFILCCELRVCSVLWCVLCAVCCVCKLCAVCVVAPLCQGLRMQEFADQSGETSAVTSPAPL